MIAASDATPVTGPVYGTVLDGRVFELTSAEAAAGHSRYVAGVRTPEARAGERIYQRLAARRKYARRKERRDREGKDETRDG